MIKTPKDLAIEENKRKPTTMLEYVIEDEFERAINGGLVTSRGGVITIRYSTGYGASRSLRDEEKTEARAYFKKRGWNVKKISFEEGYNSAFSCAEYYPVFEIRPFKK